ncbi:MAG: ester cyclase [Acidobacteria bacterium]|nr:ester cyclase [Acidobacteriota bacterium]MCA1619792.1 ester cyclase [Acidobacteriota bacterium]
MSEEYEALDNAALIRRWFEEVWNKGRAEAIDELFDEEGVAHGLAGEGAEGLRGPTGFRPFHRQFREAFPGVEVVVDDTITEGDKVAARCTVRGRHEGDTLGFRATQQPVEFTGITFARVRGGKIVEAWNNFDFMSMYSQLGALRLDAGAEPPDPDDALPSLD